MRKLIEIIYPRLSRLIVTSSRRQSILSYQAIQQMKKFELFVESLVKQEGLYIILNKWISNGIYMINCTEMFFKFKIMVSSLFFCM